MTREERNNAIKVLKNYDLNNSKVNSLLFSAEEITNAFDIAIKALEQQSEDAISREDALKALAYDIESFEFKSGVSRHMNEIANLLNTIYEIQSDNIKALPSVQPKYSTSEWCHDCKEYDQDKHCCPRFNKVIRNTVEEMKHEKIKTGHWIDNHTTCGCCGWQMIDDVMESPNMVFFPFCPNCGAKMVEPQAENEEA